MIRFRRFAPIAYVAMMCGFAAAQSVCMMERVSTPPPGSFSFFGWSVDISGETAIVGADWEWNELGNKAGAAYIFQNESGQWVQKQKLLASDGGPSQFFGHAVAVDDTRAAVISGKTQPGAAAAGTIYVYELDGSEWIEAHRVGRAQGHFQDGWGGRIDLVGDVIIVSASSDNENGPGSGAAYVYRFNGREWIEVQKLTASDAQNEGNVFSGFGTGLALGHNILFVGASGHSPSERLPGFDPDIGVCNSGAVYAFEYDETDGLWTETQIIVSSDYMCYHHFGRDVDFDEQRLIVGTRKGWAEWFSPKSAHIFEYDEALGQWVEEQSLTAPPGYPTGSNFARKVAIHGDVALIAEDNPQPLLGTFGTAHLYRRGADGVWQHTDILLPQPNPSSQIFGRAIALSEKYAIVGATGEDNSKGAAYVFDVHAKVGDLNCDGVVDALDLMEVIDAWGPCPNAPFPADCPADLTGDGVVNIFDLLKVLANWG